MSYYSLQLWKNRPKGLSGEELIAWALTEVAEGLHYHAFAMGTRDAGTELGATEVLANAITEGFRELASSLDVAVWREK